MFRHYQFLALLLAISADRLQGQYYFYNDKYYNSQVLAEVGLSVGGFNCLTDLGGRKGNGKSFLKDVNWQNTQAGGGIYLVVLFDQLFGFRAEASIGKISASDHVLRNDQSTARNRYNRNLHFQSKIMELSLSTEFYPLSFITRESRPLFSPYLLAGIGLFNFNPGAYLNGQWIDLQPLRTEGQGFNQYPYKEPYRLTQLNFPIGCGVRYEISAVLNARIEIFYRLLRTDYLDDVSTQYIDPDYFRSNLRSADIVNALAMADRSGELQPGLVNPEGAIRGNPENRDAFFSCNIKLGVILNRKHR